MKITKEQLIKLIEKEKWFDINYERENKIITFKSNCIYIKPAENELTQMINKKTLEKFLISCYN